MCVLDVASVSVAFVYSCSWCLIKEANFIFASACALRFDIFSKQLKWENENAKKNTFVRVVSTYKTSSVGQLYELPPRRSNRM